MKRTITTLFTIFITRILIAQVCDGEQVFLTENGQCNGDPYVLEFEDDFNGNTLDLSKWQIQPWAQGALQGDLTQEYNSLDNVSLQNGICKITAKHEVVSRRAINWLSDNEILSDGLPNLRTYNYTSSNIWTNRKFGYGKYEIRCKLPAGIGFWPAFWMFGNNDINAAINNEIDVFEFWDGSTTKHHMTVHYNNQFCETNYDNGPDYSQAFHTFTVLWDNYKIEWYVDGVLKRRSTKFYTLLGQPVDCNGLFASTLLIRDNIFPQDPMNIVVNLAIQTGTFAPDNNTSFPNSLEIDYIKYYKQIKCNDDLIFWDINQLNLSNEVYNFIVGSRIVIGSNITIQNGQQLELVAGESIELLPGFSAQAGSNFEAHINPNICDNMRISGPISENLTSADTVLFLPDLYNIDTSKAIPDLSCKIKAYPNPSNNTLTIEFDKNLYDDYKVYLNDSQGKTIFESNGIAQNIINIDISELANGIYFLNVFDKENKQAFVNKIIINK